MSRESSSTGSGSNEAHARSSTTSLPNKRVSLTRIRRDASVELDDETSASDYTQDSGSASEEDADAELRAARPSKKARVSKTSSNSPTSANANYTTLKTETRSIDAKLIKNTWRPTTAAAQSKIKNVLSLVERPVINVNRAPERRIEAQASLASLSRIFAERLPRMPFPPDTKEWHFDYEAILRNNRDLETQLAATNHSIILAQAEIAKEEKLLAEANTEKAELERNAKAEQKIRAQRARGTQQLWTEIDGRTSDDAKHIGLQEFEAHRSTEISEDTKEVYPFIEQLESHLGKIEQSLTGLVEVADTIDAASIELRRSSLLDSS